MRLCLAAAGLILSACTSPAHAPPAAPLAVPSTPPAPTATEARHTPSPYVELTHPDWTRDAVIYQINTRQFTPEGTFAAAEGELERLADLGVDILWLMPIHPIGEVNRKGTLGSPYSVKDYFGVNPEFGTPEDLKRFIEAAHALDMRVILDWVANHSAWDNPLTETHPEWYERDWDGDFMPTPWWDWSDIIDFDYDQPALRAYMADAMAYWVREYDVDGFRADVAGYVPLAFWEAVRADLDAIKPVFMLAEFDQRDVHKRAFDATYAWGWKDVMQAIARGDANATGFFGYYSGNESVWPRDAYRMVYTSNHDQNAWDEAAPILYGPAYEAAIVLSFIGEGMPLIYNGQEAYNTGKLAFFEKDPIVWQDHPIEDLFRRLITLKTETSALHNGAAGARMVPLVNTAPEQVLSFSRADGNGGVIALFNFSDAPATVQFTDGPYAGTYRDWESGASVSLSAVSEVRLDAWGWTVLLHTPAE